MTKRSTLFVLAVQMAFALGLPQSPSPVARDDPDAPLIASVSAAVASASLKPYATPLTSGEIKEWGAYGDSFTAGIGSNGLADYDGYSQSCSRYKQAYPNQMNADGRWPGDPAQRTLNFGACSGNVIKDVHDKQLTDSAPVDYNNFGKPQLAVMTVGGNDLGFETAINACIIRAHGYPSIPDCNSVLTGIENKIDDLGFQGSLDELFLSLVVKGRVNGGANPPESFQLYVNGYVPFWNEVDEGCNTISWEWWWTTTDHLLTTDLRKRMNDIVKALNFQIKRSAFRLANEGVFYVEGFQDSYTDHQFCDPKADTNLAKPISPNTWFWASDSPWNGGEGPTSSSDYSLPQAILNALVPDAGQRASITTNKQSPSDFNVAFKSQEAFEAALDGLKNNSDPSIAAIPEAWRRIFHPKGTAYAHHSDVNLNTVLANRNGQAAAAAPTHPPPPPPPPPDADICGDWYKVVLDYFEIRGVSFDPDKFGADGAGLKKQIEGCGKLTKWSFTYTPNDPRFAWFAHGQLPLGTKACVGRAVVSAGGEGPDGCTGSG
ncbi:hypothetical protein N7G274_001898 [Stereocaulon virgatum]|uniref:SGNH hydrolase-type esterase domain-containing protein n=1 Tax=Stereocaulon virgatum TaxID=373712 RepID=A0ABR4AI93_9LECA